MAIFACELRFKVLHSELCTQEFLLQMRQEASKLAKLRHPCIAHLLDWKLNHGENSLLRAGVH